ARVRGNPQDHDGPTRLGDEGASTSEASQLSAESLRKRVPGSPPRSMRHRQGTLDRQATLERKTARRSPGGQVALRKIADPPHRADGFSRVDRAAPAACSRTAA